MKMCNKCNTCKSLTEFYKHKSTKDGYETTCKICIRNNQKKYYLNNSDKAKESTKKWRELNKEHISEYRKKHYKNNKSHEIQYAREYRKAYPEAVKARVLDWKANNPNNCRIYAQNRRIGKLSGNLSKNIADKLLTLQKGKCACCGKPLNGKYHLDHIIPLIKGGLNIDTNIQLLLPLCNMQKHDKDPVDFMQSRGFLL